MIVRLAAPLALALSGCSHSTSECDCAEPGAHVHVAPEAAAAVTEVRLSGAACDGQTATCTQPAAVGCATYSITAGAPGECTVEVIFTTGSTYRGLVTFERGGSCCTGLYPTPASAGDITASPGPTDGGSSG